MTCSCAAFTTWFVPLRRINMHQMHLTVILSQEPRSVLAERCCGCPNAANCVTSFPETNMYSGHAEGHVPFMHQQVDAAKFFVAADCTSSSMQTP